LASVAYLEVVRLPSKRIEQAVDDEPLPVVDPRGIHCYRE